ncbi:MAG: peptidylprolyl isomerase [Bacteroidota bacterium]
MKKSILIAFAILLSVGVFAQKAASKKSKVKPKKIALKEYVLITTSYGNMVFTLYDETPKHRDNFKKLIREKYYDSLLFHRIIRDFMIQGGDPESRHADSLQMLGNGGPGYNIPAEIHPNIIHQKGALAAARLGDNVNPNKESSGSQFYIVQGKKTTKAELEQVMNQKNLARKQMALTYLLENDTNLRNQLTLIQQTQGRDALQSEIMKLEPKINTIYKKQEFIYTNDHLIAYTTVGGTPFLDMDYTVFGQMISGFDVLDRIAIVYTNPQTNRPFSDIRMKISLIKR